MLLAVPWHKVGKWQLLSDGKIPLYNVRVGSCFPFISIACYDIYDNWMPFSSIPDFKIKLIMNEGLLVDVTKMKPFLSSDKLVLNIELPLELYGMPKPVQKFLETNYFQAS
ncbi:hypothetical protein QUC31_008294 [Theobroma cacao]